MKITEAVELCSKFERVLSPIGWHIGLTGSTLYGPGEAGDLDIIIYPHIKDNGQRSKLKPEEVLQKLRVCDVEHLDGAEYGGYVDYIYTGALEGELKIDAFFLK